MCIVEYALVYYITGNRDLSMPQVSSSPTQVDPFYSRGY